MKGIVATILTVLFLLWAGVRIVNHIQFDRNIGGYLKRAADANTVELAEKNLSVAVEYLERNGLTSGYPSILWRTPDEDVDFWFTNLKSSLDELHSVKPEAAQLEKTNVLMKLRETLLDQGNKGSTSVTAPSGMSVFPNNTAYALWGEVSFILSPAFIGVALTDY